MMVMLLAAITLRTQQHGAAGVDGVAMRCKMAGTAQCALHLPLLTAARPPFRRPCPLLPAPDHHHKQDAEQLGALEALCSPLTATPSLPWPRGAARLLQQHPAAPSTCSCTAANDASTCSSQTAAAEQHKCSTTPWQHRVPGSDTTTGSAMTTQRGLTPAHAGEGMHS